MTDRDLRCSRRKFLASAAALAVASQAKAPAAEPVNPSSGFRARPPQPSIDGRKPIGVVTTVYRPLSHSFHIAGRFLSGYTRDGSFHIPQHYVRAVYTEQTPENDLTADLARECSFLRSKSIAEALLDGDKLAVEGVLLIAEHGNYPRNEKGQILYPRWDMFQQ